MFVWVLLHIFAAKINQWKMASAGKNTKENVEKISTENGNMRELAMVEIIMCSEHTYCDGTWRVQTARIRGDWEVARWNANVGFLFCSVQENYLEFHMRTKIMVAVGHTVMTTWNVRIPSATNLMPARFFSRRSKKNYLKQNQYRNAHLRLDEDGVCVTLRLNFYKCLWEVCRTWPNCSVEWIIKFSQWTLITFRP